MKLIVSYDGSGDDRDALALGRLLADAGASLELAYVQHAGRRDHDAEALLAAGADAAGRPDAPRHVVLSGSTAEGLRELALTRGADVVVFGSEYRTAPGHVEPQATARRLLDGGPVALALAPAGYAEREDVAVETVVALGEEGDPCVQETAEALARRLGAAVVRDGRADLLVVGSKPGTVTGRVTVGAAAEYLIGLAGCPVLVLPRGVAVTV